MKKTLLIIKISLDEINIFSRFVRKACMKFLQSQASGSETHDAWNKTSVYFVNAAEVTSFQYFFLLYFLIN